MNNVIKIFLVVALSVASMFSIRLKAEVNPAMFYSYNTSTNGSFYVYQKINENGVYLEFRIYHQKSTPLNCDLWRVLEGYLVRYNGSTMTRFQQVLQGGENEFVWKSNRLNVGDFTGGYHGDERIDIDPTSNVKFYADGLEVNFSNAISLTPCTTFYYHQFSTMHQTGTGGTDSNYAAYVPVPGNPIDCFHEKKTVFENSGFVTYNKAKWNAAVPIKNCFIGILCVNKDITTEGYNEYGTIANFNQNGANKLTSDKMMITMKNPTMGISVICNTIINSMPFNPPLTSFVWDNNNYHKYYADVTATTTNINDVWDTKSILSYSYIEPSTSVAAISNDQKNEFQIVNGVLIIEGLLTSDHFYLYNSSGLLIAHGDSTTKNVYVSENGIFILKIMSPTKTRSYKLIS